MTTKTNNAVDFLLEQHATVRRLFAEITNAPASGRGEPFEAVVRLLAVHETAEEEVVYPVVKRKVPNGDAIVKARREEEDRAKKALSGLEKIDPASDDFMPLFTQVKQMVDEHASNEEREVF